MSIDYDRCFGKGDMQVVSGEPLSLEWQSILTALANVSVRTTFPQLDQQGILAYTDGACIKNPGGPAGWSSLLWAASDWQHGQVRPDALTLEVYGHIPKSETTTNNRAEIAAVLAVLSLAPPQLPLKIYSDSEYTIKVAQGTYKASKNPDLWAIYKQLAGFRKTPPVFEWVRGHAGHLHNERADELAGLGAFAGNHTAFEQWEKSQKPEARNSLASSDWERMKQQVEKLQAFVASGKVSVGESERTFILDMQKRLRKKTFVPSEKQTGWLKGLMLKYKL